MKKKQIAECEAKAIIACLRKKQDGKQLRKGVLEWVFLPFGVDFGLLLVSANEQKYLEYLSGGLVSLGARLSQWGKVNPLREDLSYEDNDFSYLFATVIKRL